MYKLELLSMLQMLQEFGQNATLETEISAIPGARGRFQVQIAMFQGKLTSCSIKDNEGQVMLASNEAVNWLQRQGPLDWTVTLRPVTTQSLPAPIQLQPPVQSSPLQRDATRSRFLVPRRLVQMERYMNGWSRKQRTIFMLVDGKKNVEQISTLLSLSAQEVEAVLYEIQRIGIIVLEEHS